jgi:hypothetical protein
MLLVFIIPEENYGLSLTEKIKAVDIDSHKESDIAVRVVNNAHIFRFPLVKSRKANAGFPAIFRLPGLF